VSRHGSDRPWRSYQPRSFRRNVRRADGVATTGLRFVLCAKMRRRILADMKIYTRTGDSGETALYGGTRVQKCNARVDAYGEVDELNACLGVVRAQADMDASVNEILAHIQKDLFAIGARLADPGARIAERMAKVAVGDADIERIEQWIDASEAELPPLRRFILPGGSHAGALLHLSRTVCRRAERAVVGLGTEHVDPLVLAYINRLSDLLFVLARAVNHRAAHAETEW
jgi:cob(I)alamin adenosyltransferase